MAFFTYRQNNSGGTFDFGKEAGISVTVIIEAPSAQAADDRAEQIGLYFNGVDAGLDCDCCGDRWSQSWGDGDPAPSIYGIPVENGQYEWKYRNWAPKGTPEGYIHYLDGRIEPIEQVKG